MSRHPLGWLLVMAALATTTACNAITDTGKYEIVDCPSGACVDGGSGIVDGHVNADASTTSEAGADAAAEPLPDCGSGRAPVRLVVTGAGGSVSSSPGGLDVPAGSIATACFILDRVELRTSGPSATWTGPSCKDGARGDRCEFDVPSGGLTVTAALP